jgi:mono/diheme cytochrome c family protein
MKTSVKFVPILMGTAILFLFTSGNHAMAQTKPWPVPAADKAIKAPVKLADKSVVDNGKELWAKHCKSCHGAKGIGDGPKSATLKSKIVSFSDPSFISQTDGEIYYKTSKGRDEMPAYEKKIPDANDRWALVAYMRTFASAK